MSNTSGDVREYFEEVESDGYEESAQGSGDIVGV